jgi:putative hydrolase of the HAD superfamily
VTVELVLFDLDDTLLDHRGASRDALAAHLGATGHAGGADAGFDRWHALEEEHYHRYLRGEIDWQGQRRARAREFVAPFGLLLERDADADAWFEGFRAASQAAWRLFDDVPECLRVLGGHRLGIITNGQEDYQRTKLAAMGLAGLDPVVCSATEGVAKPDPEIFARACARAGIPADRACYVGDRLRTDAIGAADAGLLGVWLDRSATASDDERAAAAAAGAVVIHGLDELPGVLARARVGGDQ